MIANVQSPASKFKRAGLVLAMASGVLGATSAWADPEYKEPTMGVYVGVGGGLVPNHRVCQGVDKDTCDRVGFGHKFYAGYSATNDVALEVTYLYFNGVNRNYTVAQNAAVSLERQNAKALAFGMDWHIQLLNDITNHIRFGVARKVETTYTYMRNGTSNTYEEYKTVPYLGAGLSYSLNDLVQFNMGFDYIFNAGNSRTLLSLGVTSELPVGNRGVFGVHSAYVGGALGQGHWGGDCPQVSGADISCDDSSVGGKIYAGTDLSPYVGLEAGLIRFGRFKLDASVGGVEQVSGNAKVDALTLAVALRTPTYSDFRGIGRLGVATVRVSGGANMSGLVTSDLGNSSDTSTQPYIGLGVEYDLTKDVKLTGSIDTTKANVIKDNESVRLISFGAQKTF
ncbi:MAG: outer membrane beta-barrel protein [Aquabacterium sp.]